LKAEEKFLRIIEERGGRALEKYINAKTRVKILCKNEHEFPLSPDSISRSNWCPKCSGRCPEQAEERFRAIVKFKEGVVLGEYKNTLTKVSVRCKNFHTWGITPGNVRTGYWCRDCAGTAPRQGKEKLQQIIIERNGILLSDYINNNTKVLIQCKKEHIWASIPSNIKSGSWCSDCNESRGENSVRVYLENNKFEFIPQELRKINEHYRMFDFYIPEMNLFVEFDGRQHFEDIEFFSKTPFDERRQADLDKNEYAFDNKTHLLRIPYYNIKEVDTILTETIEFIWSLENGDILVPGDDYYD
jgi:very-short-patch-repair endonuclease